MDCSQCIKPCVESEIGKLDYVMLHIPGSEIEHMTPKNANKYLFSDILNLHEALEDYKDFQGSLKKVANVIYFTDLFKEIVQKDEVRNDLIHKICERENVKFLEDSLKNLPPHELVRIIIEGFDNNDIKDRYILPPMPNLFFMRDASFVMFDDIMISRMATNIRDRETVILDAVYKNASIFKANVVHLVETYSNHKLGSIEGGDVHIARNDIVLIGYGKRTSKKGIDALVKHLKNKGGIRHLIIQELPLKPDSFIHLDMVFTLLDVHKCMIFKPVILNSNYKTIHIEVDGHNYVKTFEENNIIEALKKLGMDLEPVYCGGDDEYTIVREQWHSGANFFSFAPGKILGYERNYNTIENLSRHGFEVLKAADVASGRVNVDDYKSCVIVFKGNELSRGGGGARCMTMPLLREPVQW